MAKMNRFDFTKKNKRTGQVDKVGYLDLKEDEEKKKCSLYFYGDIVSATWESMWYEEDKCPQDIADFLHQLDSFEDLRRWTSRAWATSPLRLEYLKFCLSRGHQIQRPLDDDYREFGSQ